MVYLPAIGKVNLYGYDIVFVDECQDLNKAQLMCVKAMIKEKGRLIAVGDYRQAIYGFAGADSESFKEIESIDNITKLPLSNCFRCARSIVDFAAIINPEIESFPKAPDGIVRYGSYKEVEEGDYILCRNNAPLVALHRILLENEKPAIIKGNDIGKGLLSLVDSLYITSLEDLFEKIDVRLSSIKKTLEKQGLKANEVYNNSRYHSVYEQRQILWIISRDCNSIQQLKNKLKSIFKEESEGIILSSIHRSKGLEAKRVFILYDDLTPSSQAESQWEIDQEDNLIYVAYTRAKKELIFINDFFDYDLPRQEIAWRSKRFDEYQNS